MNCLRPKVIPKPGLPDRPMSGQVRPYLYDNLVVPCGKCFKCLSARQDSFACRIRAEADKRGTMSLVTLTYNEDNLPLVSTLWRVDKETGEAERLTDPDFVCYSRKEDFFWYREDFKKMQPSRIPRYLDVPYGIEDDEYSYFMRITPSCCRKDVQLWLKSCRNNAKKQGLSLDFSYAVCSEMGPRTCRPHYHCVFFGLSPDQVEIFSRLWTYGFVDVKHVSRVNPDGTDGFGRVSEYVGKYVSKGSFECESVKCGAAVGTRMMSSKGLGSHIVEKFQPYVCAFDVIGAPYDLDTFFCQDKKRYLNRQELSLLVAEIPKRLAVSFDGKRYFAFPRVLRNKIFYVKKVSTSGNTTYYRPSRLWKMVVDTISKQYADIHQREFELFLSNYDKGKIAEAVSFFAFMSENAASIADDVGKKDYQARLSKSKF